MPADAYDFWAARMPREQTARIDGFWERFSRAAKRIDRHFSGLAPHVDPDREMRTALREFADRLYWDFEPGDEAGRRLVLSAELRHQNRVLARAMVHRFPEIEGWTVSDARLPVASIPAAVQSILFRSRSEALAVEELAPRAAAHRLVDLDARGRGEQAFLSDQAGIVFAVLLGDRADQDWLGDVRVQPPRVPGLLDRLRGRMNDVPVNSRWLSEFRTAAVDVISRFEADRPERPFAEAVEMPRREYRLTPREQDPGRRRDATRWWSRYPALAAARLAGTRITSLRFSRFGESFCGIKIRRTEGAPYSEPEALARLADRLQTALRQAGLGGVTGAGHGISYVYLDLALGSLEEAARKVRRELAEAEVTAPAWMIFDEAGLEDRYFPLVPGTPPTPLS